MAGEQISFDQWLLDMDKIFVHVFGMSYNNFPDWNWYDAFEYGLTPTEAVEAYGEEMDDGF